MKERLGLAGFLCCMFAVLAISSCGGGGSGDSGTTGTYSVTTTVSMPTITSPSASRSIKSFSKAATDVATSGVVVQPQDLDGNNIGTPCTTGADGTCACSGLTSAQLQAGVVFVSENMHSLQKFDSTEVAAADAGTALTAPVNAEEDMLYAVVAYNCGGSLAARPPTIDFDCLHDATAVLPGDDSPGTDTVDGSMEANLEAHRLHLINDPANAMSNAIAAYGGSTAAYVAGVGATEVSSVPVADAVANSQIGASAVSSAYCTRASADAASPWETARAAATTVDVPTFSRAFAGMFEYFPPAELQAGTYPPATFQGFMTAGPQLTDFFTAFGGSDNDLARNSAVQAFKNGMFAEPANAPVAVGFVAATFPPPANGVYDWTGNAYDPTTAMVAANNTFVATKNTAGFDPVNHPPNTVYSGFNGALADPTRRTTFANGGVSDYVGAYMASPTNFVPADHYVQIKAPPGASCTSNSDCLPCDSCVSSLCVAGSTYMGSSCTTNTDCNDGGVTLCTGGAMTYATLKCMCASSVPTGVSVHTADGAAQPYNTTGGYVPPASGAMGGTCGPTVSCSSGLTCTDSAHGGVCANSATYKKTAGMGCSSGSECFSNTCTSNVCVASASEAGAKTNGTPCGSPNECQSLYCTGGFCTASGGGSGTLKPDGSACATNAECGSGYCSPSLICAQQSGQQSGAPNGSYCNNNTMCQSLHCDMGRLVCASM